MTDKIKLKPFQLSFKKALLGTALSIMLFSPDAFAQQAQSNYGVAGGSLGSNVPSFSQTNPRANQPVVVVDGNQGSYVPVEDRAMDANVDTEVVKVPVPIYQPVYQSPTAPQAFMNQGYQAPMQQPYGFGAPQQPAMYYPAAPQGAPMMNNPYVGQQPMPSIQIDQSQTGYTTGGRPNAAFDSYGGPLPDINYNNYGGSSPIQHYGQTRMNQNMPQSPMFEPSQRTTQSMNTAPYQDVRPAPGLVFEIEEIENLGEETIITRKIETMNEDLENLHTAIALAKEQLENIRFSTEIQAADYYAVVAAIQARLQAGSTPGNPRLVNSWNIAQDRLDRLSEDVDALGELSQRVAAQGNMASYLLEAVRASFGLSGALEADHASLEILEDDVTSTVVAINRLLNEITDDVNRRTAYLASERKNLQTLASGITNGELFGRSLTNQYMRRVTDPNTPQGMQRLQTEGMRPLAIIRFNKENVNYQQPVFSALNDAIRINPNAQFEIIAVSSNDGTSAETALAATEARQKAENVIRTLSNMGLPNGKMLVSNARSAEADGAEVHIYVR
ncbi:MAG: hypothetical protein CMP22_01335 [Rickettsiales bacterium]|nr:hypothetical protein [Rickettsiales bacterium]